MGEPNFWEDRERASQVAARVSNLKRRLEQFDQLQDLAEEAEILLEVAQEEVGENGQNQPSEETSQELAAALERLDERVGALELDSLLAGEYDHSSAILAIHPGAGGTESQDWAEMLLRMYTRWAERRGFQAQLLDLLPGEEAGIKSATLQINGENAYGYLQAERGVHRLVRISPFDAAGRRHTSFASVDVWPVVEGNTEIEIRPEDLKVDTYRSSGAGGQYVNKTESAIRITHLPTGIVVQCQNERSQHANRETAMRMLKAQLLQRRLEEQQQKMNQLRGEHGEIAWGNQIRSYVFCPYTMVKDHRTGEETANVQAVMDGEIDRFIEAYLRHRDRPAEVRL